MSSNVPPIAQLTDAELGAAAALLGSLADRAGDDVPGLAELPAEALRYRLARDDRESGLRWFGARCARSGALEGLAGYDPAGGGSGAVQLDGPVVWIDLRRRGLGSALLAHVQGDIRARLGSVEVIAAVGEGNRGGAAFIEHHGFVLRVVRRTLSCTAGPPRRVPEDGAVSVVTPADAGELAACGRLLAGARGDTGAAAAELQEAADSRNSVQRMALAGAEVVGFAQAFLDRPEETAWIDRLVCLPGWRERGVEDALLSSLLADCFTQRRIRRARAELETPPGIDPRQLDRYEAAGFHLERCDLEYARRL